MEGIWEMKGCNWRGRIMLWWWKYLCWLRRKIWIWCRWRWCHNWCCGGEQFCLSLPHRIKLCITFARSKFIIIQAIKLRRYMITWSISYQRDIAGINRGVCQEYSDTSAIGPFVMWLLRLEFLIQHVHGRSEGMNMLNVDLQLSLPPGW